jgi:hypothetical protein
VEGAVLAEEGAAVEEVGLGAVGAQVAIARPEVGQRASVRKLMQPLCACVSAFACARVDANLYALLEGWRNMRPQA